MKHDYDNKGHVWMTHDDDDTVDIFAYTPSEYCNGPRCIHCGYGFCHHCHDEPQIECSTKHKYLTTEEYIAELEKKIDEDEVRMLQQRRLR